MIRYPDDVPEAFFVSMRSKQNLRRINDLCMSDCQFISYIRHVNSDSLPMSIKVFTHLYAKNTQKKHVESVPAVRLRKFLPYIFFPSPEFLQLWPWPNSYNWDKL